MIRDRISEIIDLPIRPGRWMTYTDALNREGRPDRAMHTRMTMTASEEIEALEVTIAHLKSRIEALEEKPVPTPSVTAPASKPEVYISKKDQYETTTGAKPNPKAHLEPASD